jgi:isoleucyl-tRNA synthetase
MAEIDQWILIRAGNLVKQCRAWYDDFAFHKVYHAVYDFATTDLSAVYFDILKDRLYTAAPRSRARRSAQTALWRLSYALVRLLEPILTFTTEEVWLNLRLPAGAPESVHLALFPEPGELIEGLTAAQRKHAKNWDRLMEVRDTVLKSLEAARQEKFIGAPLEARVHLKAGADLYPLLESYAAELPALFIVSQVDLERHDDKVLSVHIARAAGAKCERCWKYSTDVGSTPELPTVCGACARAVAEIAGC